MRHGGGFAGVAGGVALGLPLGWQGPGVWPGVCGVRGAQACCTLQSAVGAVRLSEAFRLQPILPAGSPWGVSVSFPRSCHVVLGWWWEEHLVQLCWWVGVEGAVHRASEAVGAGRAVGVRASPPPDTPLAPSGQVRILQRGRQREGPDKPAHDRGGRALGDAETWGHDHRADIWEHRCVCWDQPGPPCCGSPWPYAPAWLGLFPSCVLAWMHACSCVSAPRFLTSCPGACADDTGGSQEQLCLAVRS